MSNDRPASSWLRARWPFLAAVAVTVAGGLGLLWFLSATGASPEVGMGIHSTFNYIEAGIWGLAGIGVFWMTRRSEPSVRRLGRVAAAAYIAFGGSDLMEVRTGAWYDPWWLFAWKAICVVVLVGCLVLFRRLRRRGTREDSLR